MVAMAVAYQAAAHWYLGPQPRNSEYLGFLENMREMWYVLRTGNFHEPVVLFFVLWVPLVLGCFVSLDRKPEAMRAALVVGLAYVALSVVAVYIRECHRNWQIVPLLAPAAVWSLFPTLRRCHGDGAGDAPGDAEACRS